MGKVNLCIKHAVMAHINREYSCIFRMELLTFRQVNPTPSVPCELHKEYEFSSKAAEELTSIALRIIDPDIINDVGVDMANKNIRDAIFLARSMVLMKG
tara:strand:- start:375 stop:671 length:297 start_codon:yes stop_codon:yes gene_type:complete